MPDPQATKPETTLVEPTLDKPVQSPATKATAEQVAAENGQVDRASFLALVGDLAEATVELTTRGGKKISVLVRELTGEERADLITLQAEAYQRGSLEMKKYEQKLMLAGVADPTSPEGSRAPLLKGGDAEMLMKLGASKTRLIVEKIEELSGMGAAQQARVEGNLPLIPRGVSTSG